MSGNARAIRTRIKSVRTTMHITRAMQLVAASKIRRATQRMEGSRRFFHAVEETFADLAEGGRQSLYMTPREEGRKLFVIMAGDRGLAGGYNANVFRRVLSLMGESGADALTVGRRACDWASTHGLGLVAQYPSLEKLTLAECVEIGEILRDKFATGEYKEIRLVYTDCVSMLSQETTDTLLLPITPPERTSEKPSATTVYEPSPEAVMAAVIPQYLTGILWGAVCMSYASEMAARRNAMDSATKNASDMIDTLSLSYNRARQGAITQEITEIVAGAEK